MRSYHNLETAAIETAPMLRHSAEAALRLLAASGAAAPCEDPERAGDMVWRFGCTSPSGVTFDIACVGRELPAGIPGEVIRPGAIAQEMPFVGNYRLTVKAPILVLDFYWRADSKLRIMTFANGEWERELARIAADAAGTHHA